MLSVSAFLIERLEELRAELQIFVPGEWEASSLPCPSPIMSFPFLTPGARWTFPVERQVGVQDHEMVQALSPDRADQTFGVRILPGFWGAVSTSFNVQCGDSQPYFVTIGPSRSRITCCGVSLAARDDRPGRL